MTAESLTATVIEGHTSSVTVLSLSMDGRTLASGAEGSNTKVFIAITNRAQLECQNESFETGHLFSIVKSNFNVGLFSCIF